MGVAVSGPPVQLCQPLLPIGHRMACRRGQWDAIKPVSLAALTCLLTATMAQERLPTILPEQYTAEQNKAVEDFLAAARSRFLVLSSR